MLYVAHNMMRLTHTWTIKWCYLWITKWMRCGFFTVLLMISQIKLSALASNGSSAGLNFLIYYFYSKGVCGPCWSRCKGVALRWVICTALDDFIDETSSMGQTVDLWLPWIEASPDTEKHQRLCMSAQGSRQWNTSSLNGNNIMVACLIV